MLLEIELGERVLYDLQDENTGNHYHRILVITERAFDAMVFSAIGRDEK